MPRAAAYYAAAARRNPRNVGALAPAVRPLSRLEIQAMGPKDKKNGAKGLRSRLKAFGITGLTGRPTAVMRAALLALRLGITGPASQAPCCADRTAPVSLVRLTGRMTQLSLRRKKRSRKSARARWMSLRMRID